MPESILHGRVIQTPERPESTMSVNDLARRVYQARHTLEVSTPGFTLHRTEVVLAPEDWAAVVTETRDPAKAGSIWYDHETNRHSIYGMDMRMDQSLAVGEVRLRTEVQA